MELIGYSFLRKDYEDTLRRVTPYMIYLDHDNADVVLAVRGLNLAKERYYAVLLDNKLGQTKFGSGWKRRVIFSMDQVQLCILSLS